MATLPGLLAMDAEPLSPWPSVDELDPFVCNLVFTALTSSSRPEVVAAMAGAETRCEIQDLAVSDLATGEGPISNQAREILQAQILLLAETGAHGGAGRLASAGIVAANVLRNEDRPADADRVGRGLELALAENDARTLREAIELVLREVAPPTVAPAAHHEPQVAARTLRIDADRIDALVNLTGELTVAKNAIGHATKLAENGDSALGTILKERYATLDRLVGELQQSVLRMRVLPLNQAFQRLPRMLREMSNDLGKPARLVVEGADTEADKAIVEMLFEPLLHVVRNAMDHGVEDASTRAAHRKPPVSTIRLHARRQGEHVIVEVGDDGAGIDVTRIRELMLERKVISEDALAAMNDEEITNMIFEPGFSTAREVTALSGRGVGMDAVRAAVGRLGGQVSVESRAGQGTTVRFTLPFSVMMTRVVIVSAGQQWFGIPLDAVVETLRIEADRIVRIGAAFATVLRNRTIPVVDLAEVLGLAQVEHRSAEATIVVTRVNGAYGALGVDRIGERMEVMLKPLDGLLTRMRGVAGSALLGDGTVLLVLDLGELFQ
jgi:two-component system chemotaxis sensor kinase CheA